MTPEHLTTLAGSGAHATLVFKATRARPSQSTDPTMQAGVRASPKAANAVAVEGGFVGYEHEVT